MSSTTISTRALTRRHFAACIVLPTALLSGCAAPPPVGVSLDYAPTATPGASADLHGVTVSLSPFADSRTSNFLYKDRLYLRESEDAGVWVANAVRMELERAGARVETLAADVRPNSGLHISGQVNSLHGESHGWTPGGLLGAATAGITGKIDLSVELVEDGVPVFYRQYSHATKYKSDALGTFMFGQNTTKEVPKALPKALGELLREQVIPDIAAAAASGATSLELSGAHR